MAIRKNHAFRSFNVCLAKLYQVWNFFAWARQWLYANYTVAKHIYLFFWYTGTHNFNILIYCPILDVGWLVQKGNLGCNTKDNETSKLLLQHYVACRSRNSHSQILKCEHCCEVRWRSRQHVIWQIPAWQSWMLRIWIYLQVQQIFCKAMGITRRQFQIDYNFFARIHVSNRYFTVKLDLVNLRPNITISKWPYTPKKTW